MPARPGKACRVNTCPNIVRDNKYQGYCEAHKDKVVSYWHINEKKKGNRHQRGYGASWDKLRAIVLKRDGRLCQSCKAQGRFRSGTHVDHIKPKAQGGSDSMSNLQTLCADCHKYKTANE